MIRPAQWFRPAQWVHPVKGLLAGRRRALLIGIVAAGAAATAAGAAPASLTPWEGHAGEVAFSHEPTTTVAEPTTTTPHEAPPTTVHHEPATTSPTSTTPTSTHLPHELPALSPPPQTPAPEQSVMEPPTTPAAPPVEPAPTTTEVHAPATLQLSCIAGGELLNQVSCEWTGSVPDGFVNYLLLRGNHTAKGRVPFSSTDPTVHTFTDETLPAGSYTYVVVVIGTTGTSIAHSNLVPIVIAAAG